MEKIKYSYVRLFLFLFFILTIMGIIFQILKPKSLEGITGMVLNDIFILLASYVLLFLYERKNPYFTSDKVVLDPLKNTFINWEDLVVELDNHEPKALNPGRIYLKSRLNKTISAKFELNWFNEKSAILTIQKYAPKHHALYAIVEDYAEKRGLKL